MVQVKRTLQILYISITCHLRQLGESSRGMETSLVEVGGTVMAPQLVKMGWGWGEPGLDPSLFTWSIFFSLLLPQTHLTSLTGEEWVLLLRRGQAGLTEFYTGHKIRQLEKFT